MEPDRQFFKVELEDIEEAQTELVELSESSNDKLLGTILDGKIRVDSIIGQGGMSVVYKGTHLVLNSPVAIKVILPGVGFNEKAVMRLQQEAKAAFSLSHKNLASVHDISQTSDGLTYLIMDFADGQTLSELIKDGPIESSKAMDIFVQIAEGLREAHSQGIIHRDIKPSNIMVDSLADGTHLVKVVDFGIAKKVTENADEMQKLTQTGEIFGTPLYMSPEQCRGDMLDARSDIYSFGCVLYEALTGVPPFKGDTAVNTILQHLNDKAPTLDKQLKISMPVVRVLNTCLEKDTNERYQKIDDLINDLQAIKYGGTTVSVPSARISARIKACVIDALIVATLGGLLLLPLAQYLFFTNDVNQPIAGASFADWRFDKFVSHIILPTYILGFGIGFAEGTFGLICLFLLVGQLISVVLTGSSANIATYNFLICVELLGLAVFNWLLHAVFESSEWQGTPGKMIMNLRVTSSSGHRLSFLQASSRHLGRSLLSFCSVTIVPLLIVSIRLWRQGKSSEISAVLSNLGNSLTHCDVRDRYTSTKKSAAFWSAAVATTVLLPFLCVLSTCLISSSDPEVSRPSKITTPHNLPKLAYAPVSRSASMVTGYLLDPRVNKPDHLNGTWSPEAAESARRFRLPASTMDGEFAKTLQGIDLTEVIIGESSSDELIPVTVAGHLHILEGKQTWMSSRYKMKPFEISYLVKWEQANNNSDPVVVHVTKFVHGRI